MVYGLDIGFIDHLYTPLGATLYRSLTHTDSRLQSVTVSTNCSLATASTEGEVPSQVLLSQPAVQNSCQLTTQLGPGLATISHQPPSLLRPIFYWQLNSLAQQPASSSIFTQLNCWRLQLTIALLLQTVLLLISRYGPYRKYRLHCYSSTIPRPLHRNGCLFIRLLHSNRCTRSTVLTHSVTHSLAHGAEPFLRSCLFCSYSRTSHHFMEPEGSYPEPDQSNPYHLIRSL
jgi:hypothetical protein